MPESNNKDAIPFAQLFETYRQNCTPGMLGVLAEQLGVSVASLEQIGVGYNFATASWVTPERDESGEVIGLVQRVPGGKKIAMTGSKRGLTYVLNPDFKTKSAYVPGKHNWIRASHDNPCPLCARVKWCMVSSDNPADPAAVLCGRSEGAVQECGIGTYLHVLKPEGDKRCKVTNVLMETDGPILCVEGMTDTAAGEMLGFVTIGRPAGSAGLKLLSQMPLAGKTVWVIGENDAGAGKKGMESTFQTLRKITGSVVKIMPPEGVKDLRQWVQHGLTREILEAYAAANGNASADTANLPSDIAHDIAEQWLSHNMIGDFPKYRRCDKQWYEYSDGRYNAIDEEYLRGDLYCFLGNKAYRKVGNDGEVTLERYKPTKSKVNDIIDALNRWCLIAAEPPCWLDNEPHPASHNLIPFQNGILDVVEYCNGNVVLYEATPAFFSTNILPYAYNPQAKSQLWIDLLNDLFNSNQAQIRLLAEWFGYNCVPDTYHEKMMLFHGKPRSGKSTVLEAMREMLGRNQCCEVTFQNLCTSFGYHAMVGKLAALIGDAKTPRARESDTALEKILQITGGDPVNVNRKFREDLASVKLFTRFTVAMNDLPAFTDHVKALEPRLNILAFENSYVGREDRSLKYRICEEAKQGKLINFALDGLKRLRKQGRFTEPVSSVQLGNQFRMIATPIYSFIDECCEIADKAEDVSSLTAEKDQLFAVWKSWCKENGRTHGLKQQFTDKLSCVPGIRPSRRRMNGDRKYVYEGISLTELAKMNYLT